MNIEGIHQLRIPLPNNPLREINCYLIPPAADDPNSRGLLIDTGFNHPDTLAALETAISTYNVSIDNLDFLATHLHSDHSGLIAKLYSENCRCYASKIDGPLINAMTSEDYWKRFMDLYHLIGLTEDQIDYLDHPGYKYCPKKPLPFELLEEGDILSYGGFELCVIDVPGHTPGQIVLYEKNRSFLISADHILDQITPNISFWGFEHGDSLAIYMKNLHKIKSLNPAIAFPAHRNVIENVSERIDALLHHHELRLSEVSDILDHNRGVMTARQVASKMHWTVKATQFDDFPSPQKWFASAEAMAHLYHLNQIGKVDMVLENHVALFSSKSDRSMK